MRQNTTKYGGNTSDALVALKVSVSGRPALAVTEPATAMRVREVLADSLPKPIGGYAAAKEALRAGSCEFLLLEAGRKHSASLLATAVQECVPVIALAVNDTGREHVLESVRGGAVSYAREHELERLPVLAEAAREAAEDGVLALWQHLRGRLATAPFPGEKPEAGPSGRKDDWDYAISEGARTRIMNHPKVRCRCI